MARTINHNTGPARRMVLMDRGRRVLAFDRANIALPASYHAWGADDSPQCENGHRRCLKNRARDGGCRCCQRIGAPQQRRAA